MYSIMILGDNREAVINNIKTNAENGDFHNKVELNDPVLSAEENRAITDNYMENRERLAFKIKSALAVAIAKTATKINANIGFGNFFKKNTSFLKIYETELHIDTDNSSF